MQRVVEQTMSTSLIERAGTESKVFEAVKLRSRTECAVQSAARTKWTGFSEAGKARLVATSGHGSYTSWCSDRAVVTIRCHHDTIIALWECHCPLLAVEGCDSRW